MRLIVMRHGEAGVHAVDAQRPLTPPGRGDVARVAGAIATEGFLPEALWHSPFRRARESAEIVSASFRQSLQRAIPLVMEETLVPEQDPLHILQHLQSQPEDSTLMLVSHMPLVNVLTGLLLDGRSGGYPYATSQAVVMEMSYPSMGCASFVKQFL